MATIQLPRPPHWMIATCGFAWLALTIASVASGQHVGVGWSTLAAMTGTLAGAAFALTGAGLLLEGWQQREFRRRTRMLRLVLLIDAQDAIRDAVSQSYRAVRPLLEAVDRVPIAGVAACVHVPATEANVRIAIAARNGLAEASVAASTTRGRSYKNLKRLADRYLHQVRTESARMMGEDPPPPFVEEVATDPPLSEKTLAVVAAAVLESDVPTHCATACDRILDLTGYMRNDLLAVRLVKYAVGLRQIGAKWARAISDYPDKLRPSPIIRDTEAAAKAYADAELTSTAADLTWRLLDLGGQDMGPLGDLGSEYTEIRSGHLQSVGRSTKEFKDLVTSLDDFIFSIQEDTLEANLVSMGVGIAEMVEEGRVIRKDSGDRTETPPGG